MVMVMVSYLVMVMVARVVIVLALLTVRRELISKRLKFETAGLFLIYCNLLQLIKFSSSAECCLPVLVPSEFAICGKNLTMNGKVGGKSHLFTLPLSICQVVIEASENPCHEVESFFTWDALRGINLDILILLVDGVLLFLLLVLIESKALARLWYTQDK